MKSLRRVALALTVLATLAPQAEAGTVRAKRVTKQTHVDGRTHDSGADLVAFYHHRNVEPTIQAKALSLTVARLRRR